MKRLAILLVAIMTAHAGASGFRQANQSAAANGMGNAFTAVANDASAVWYNPAAMTDFTGTNISLGSVFVAPQIEHKNTNGTFDKPESKVHALPHTYVIHKLTEKWALGLGVNVPFGLSTDWDKLTANTRKIATESGITAINYNLSGAYRVNDTLSVAAGFSYVTVDATLNKWHPVLAEEIVLEGDGNGVAYNAAVLYKHNSKFSLAANYRSQVRTDIEGDMTATLVFTGPVKTELTLPDTFQLGAAYKPNSSWIISAEADYTNWTTYNEIVIKKQSDGSTVSTDYKDWKSVWAFRLGAEHKVNENWKLRAGTYYDLTPVLDHRFETRNPDSNRLAFSIGAGWTRGNLTIDASYLYLKFMERTIVDSMAGGTSVTATSQTLNGTYNSIARLPAISVGYKF